MSYGNVANVYALCEYLAFGPVLQATREYYLDELELLLKGDGKRVLLLGGGDGRFLEALLKRGVAAEIDFIEVSQRMINVAGRRLSRGGLSAEQVRWCRVPFAEWAEEGYDLVCAHFYIDNFDTDAADRELSKMVDCLKPGGELVLSDFDPAVAWWGKCVVSLMQMLFRITCGLRPKDFKVPDQYLESMGMKRMRCQKRLGGFIFTTKWKKW